MTPAFLPLRLVEEHLDALEGLLARREALRLDRRPVAASVAKVGREVELRLRALALRRSEALHEASLRLHARSPGAVRAAAAVLLSLDRSRLIEDGRVRLVGRTAMACLPLLCDLPRELVATFGELDGPALVARATHGLASDEGIRRAAWSSDSTVRWAGLLAGAAQRDPSALEPALEVLKGWSGGRWDALTRRSALFAIGRLVSRHPDDTGPAGLVEALLGARVFELPGAALIGALFGHVATGLRLHEGIRQNGPRDEWVTALGVLGLPEMLSDADDWVAKGQLSPGNLSHARHALFGEGRVAAGKERQHLGRRLTDLPLAGSEQPPSAQWLAGLHGQGACRPPLQLIVHGPGSCGWSLLG